MSVNFESNFKQLNIPGNEYNNHNQNIELNYNNSSDHDLNNIQNLLPSENGDDEPRFNIDNNSVSSSGSSSIKRNNIELDYEEQNRKKAFYLTEIERYKSLGCNVYKNYDMSHSFDELSGAYFHIKHVYESKNGLNLYRNIMKTGFSLLETADGKFNMIGDLEGVSLHVESNINSFDDILIELHQKYGGLKGPPELRLIATAGIMIATYKMSKYASKNLYSYREDEIKNTVNKKSNMKGPSDKILNDLKNLDIDSDNGSVSGHSDISSVKSDMSISSLNDNLNNMSFSKIDINPEPVKVPKKRGRKAKNPK